MSAARSRIGFALVLMYLAGAIFVIRQELVYPAGGWIALSGMGTFIVTLPSQATLGVLLTTLDVPKIQFTHTGLVDYAQLAGHVLVTALAVYLFGAAIEWVVRRIVRSTSRRLGATP